MINVAHLKHGPAIVDMFNLFFTPDMSDEEKVEFVMAVCDQLNLTLDSFDDDLETGVQNGYPVDVQIGMVKLMIEAAESK